VIVNGSLRLRCPPACDKEKCHWFEKPPTLIVVVSLTRLGLCLHEQEHLRRQLQAQSTLSRDLARQVESFGAASQAVAAAGVPHLSEQYGYPVDLDFASFPPPPPGAEQGPHARTVDVALRSAPPAGGPGASVSVSVCVCVCV
jgi:hypothetical protein